MRPMLLTFFLVASQAQAESITVFGIPLGSKLSYSVKRCNDNFPPTKVACWVGNPFRNKSGTLGNAMLPNQNLPEWAVHRSASISLSKSNDVEYVEISNIPTEEEIAIKKSVSLKFGEPSYVSRVSNGGITNWKHPEAVVELICPLRGECQIRFESQASHLERQARIDANEKERRSRPASP